MALTASLFLSDAIGAGITLTLNNPNVTVVGGNSFTLSLTLSNNTDQNVTAEIGTPYGSLQPLSFSGDLTDFYFFAPFCSP